MSISGKTDKLILVYSCKWKTTQKLKKKKKEQTPDIFSNMDESLTWGKSTQMQKTILSNPIYVRSKNRQNKSMGARKKKVVALQVGRGWD